MCIAIVCQTGRVLDNDRLWRGWTSNPDGGGIAYLDAQKKVQIATGFMKYGDFQKAYEQISKSHGENGPMLVHMRIRSTGSKTVDNCHPFRIKDGAMIHNGTMFYPTPPKLGDGMKGASQKSDTRIFAETFHNILDKDSLKLAEDKLLDVIGTFNKLCFLYDGGDYVILNEEAYGTYWEEGIWYSNSGCKR